MTTFAKQIGPEARPSKADLFVSARFRQEELLQLKGAALSVLLAYRSHANTDDVAWPSLGALAKVTGYGINAVKSARRKLVSAGYLVPIEQLREGGEFGRKVFKVFTVGLKQCHGTAALSTVAPSTVGLKQCQEGSPVQGIPVKGNPEDAVRRLFDAELQRVASTKKRFSPSARREKLSARLNNAIRKNGSAFPSAELGEEEQAAFEYIQYEVQDPRSLPDGFVDSVLAVWEEYKTTGLAPGILCSKIIDRCMAEQESCKKLGGFLHPSEFYWPPDFQDHRDRLREQERASEIGVKG